MRRRDVFVALAVSTTVAGCLGGDDEPSDSEEPSRNRTDVDSRDDSDDDGSDDSNNNVDAETNDDADGDDEESDDSDDDSSVDWEQRVEDAIESSDHTVTVGGDEDVFDPEELEVTAGESVAFVWNGNNYRESRREPTTLVVG